jgi:hypothetical protein
MVSGRPAKLAVIQASSAPSPLSTTILPIDGVVKPSRTSDIVCVKAGTSSTQQR